MAIYHVEIGAVENVYYSAIYEVEAATPEAAEEIAKEDFYFDSSPYCDGSDDITIQELFCEEMED